MTNIAQQRSTWEHERAGAAAPDANDHGTVSQSGAALFPELVWAHFRWERRRRSSDEDAEALEQAYAEKLIEFESRVGPLEEVYWSRRAASAVAMTVCPDRDERRGRSSRPRRWLQGPRLREPDQIARLHRVSDWATRDTKGVADLLQECDLLAIKVGEVLRGTAELIALRWILGVQAHVLGFMERGPRKPDEKAAQELVRTQRRELAEIEAFYHRAASKSGRIVYVTGMLIGMLVATAIALATGLLLWVSGLWGDQHLVILCFAAGAVGALVSALSRMSKPETGRFNVDFELGRPLLRRLGFFRPFVGVVFGVALYFLLSSKIVDINFAAGAKPYYYGFAAFLAGFSERYTNVVFGAAERRLVPGDGMPSGKSPFSTQELEQEEEQVSERLCRIETDLAGLEARLT